jgi:hypothetical protein
MTIAHERFFMARAAGRFMEKVYVPGDVLVIYLSDGMPTPEHCEEMTREQYYAWLTMRERQFGKASGPSETEMLLHCVRCRFLNGPGPSGQGHAVIMAIEGLKYLTGRESAVSAESLRIEFEAWAADPEWQYRPKE